MELTGEKVIEAPRERLFEALRDRVVLRQTLPGIRSIGTGDEGGCVVELAVKLGGLRAKLEGAFDLYDDDPPAGYSLFGRADAGALGGVHAHAHVALASVDETATNVAYHLSVDLEGRLGELEPSVVEAKARELALEFFSRLELCLVTEEQTAELVQLQGSRAPIRLELPPPAVDAPETAETGDAAASAGSVRPSAPDGVGDEKGRAPAPDAAAREVTAQRRPVATMQSADAADRPERRRTSPKLDPPRLAEPPLRPEPRSEAVRPGIVLIENEPPPGGTPRFGESAPDAPARPTTNRGRASPRLGRTAEPTGRPAAAGADRGQAAPSGTGTASASPAGRAEAAGSRRDPHATGDEPRPIVRWTLVAVGVLTIIVLLADSF